MKNLRHVFVLIVFILLSCCPIYPKEENKNTDMFSDKIYYPIFKAIESFGIINVYFEGEQASKIGLDRTELIDYLHKQFNKYFPNFPYDDVSNIGLIELDKSKGLKTIGSINVRIWIVGKDYPTAYHLSLNVGNMDEMMMYNRECLGYVSVQDIPSSIKKWIEKEIEKLAIIFYKAKVTEVITFP